MMLGFCMPPIPNTHHGKPLMPCLSALQKAIRRGDAETAMQFASELLHTSKAFFTAVCNRLEIISHEDVGVPEAILFVATCVEQAKRFHKPPPDIGPARLMIGNAIRFLCQSRKTRAGTNFAAAIGLENLNGTVPEIPDYAYDMHTGEGRRGGRGMEHFLSELKMTKEIPLTAADRRYRDRAIAQWELRRQQQGLRTR